MGNGLAPFVELLDGELAPLRRVAGRFAGGDSWIDPTSGAALLSPRPAIAPEAYACVMFPGVSPKDIARYEEVRRSTDRQPLDIPEVYKNVLLRLNGATLFRMTLFGLPTGMCQDPPMLDRSARQPLDLGTANSSWRKPYAPRPSQFQFGSGPYAHEENTAYFLNEDGSIDALLHGGRRVWTWSSLKPFLTTELARAEALFVDFEAAMQRRT